MNQQIAIQDTFSLNWSSWFLVYALLMKAFFQNSEVWPVLLALGSCPLPWSCGYRLLSDRLVFIHCLPKLGNFIILLIRECARRWKSEFFLSLSQTWGKEVAILFTGHKWLYIIMCKLICAVSLHHIFYESVVLYTDFTQWICSS